MFDCDDYNNLTHGYPDALVTDAHEDFEEAMVKQTIREEAEWLQSSPHTTLEIASKLFPWELQEPVEKTGFQLLLALCMWDEGYSSVVLDSLETEWRWLEGK